LIKSELTAAATEKISLREQISQLEAKLAAAEAKATEKVSQASVVDEKQAARIKELEKQLVDEKVKFTDLEKEQEDLLVCMGKLH
jgi:aminoglycoside phosphotransferase